MFRTCVSVCLLVYLMQVEAGFRWFPRQPSDCVSSCKGIPDGDYHSCKGCDQFATCSHEILHDGRPCPGGLVWDDYNKRCAPTSKTCGPVKHTGCVKSCKGVKDGDYHSCKGCHMYATCSNGILHDERPCAPNGNNRPLVWDDNSKTCEYSSSTCNEQGETNVCEQDMQCGPCHKSIPRYYYDRNAKECKRFYYSGCGGNGNNFVTKKQCRRTCKAKKGCVDDEGNTYKVGEPMKGGKCEVCKCSKYGIRICSGPKCPPVKCTNPVKKGGKCCPECPKVPECTDEEGRKYKVGEPMKGGKCEVCKCSKYGIRICRGPKCPPVKCTNPVKKGGKCCPECPKIPDVLQRKEAQCCPTAPGIACCEQVLLPTVCYPYECTDEEGRKYKVGEPMKGGKCEVCKCSKYGIRICRGPRCPAVKCTNPVKKGGKCCPECPYIPVCQRDMVCGQCSKYALRFYYNGTTQTCNPFIYSGCGSNGNNFETVEQCEKKCLPGRKACMLEKDCGPCNKFRYLYYYDATKNKCKPFWYGGCGGNANRFLSKKACERVCKRSLRG